MTFLQGILIEDINMHILFQQLLAVMGLIANMNHQHQTSPLSCSL